MFSLCCCLNLYFRVKPRQRKTKQWGSPCLKTPASYVLLKGLHLSQHLYTAHLVAHVSKETLCTTLLWLASHGTMFASLATMKRVRTLWLLMELLCRRPGLRKRKTMRRLKNRYASFSFFWSYAALLSLFFSVSDVMIMCSGCNVINVKRGSIRSVLCSTAVGTMDKPSTLALTAIYKRWSEEKGSLYHQVLSWGRKVCQLVLLATIWNSGCSRNWSRKDRRGLGFKEKATMR